jgi:DNA transformation protein
MPPSESFKEFIKDQLAGFGPVSIRNMFDGAGIYADGVMFAILADDTLYLKADEISSPAFAAEGMQPFTYTPKGKAPVAMSYWEVPPRLLEKPDELAEWARDAYRIASANAAKKTVKKKAQEALVGAEAAAHEVCEVRPAAATVRGGLRAAATQKHRRVAFARNASHGLGRFDLGLSFAHRFRLGFDRRRQHVGRERGRLDPA